MSKREQVNPRTAAMAHSRGKDYREGWEDGIRSLDAEIARLRATLLDALPAQMSYAGRLVSIDSSGMREVVDEAMQLRAKLEKAEAVVRAAEDVARHLHNLQVWTDRLTEFPYESADRLNQALAAYRERA